MIFSPGRRIMYAFGVVITKKKLSQLGYKRLPDGVRLNLESHEQMMMEALKYFFDRAAAGEKFDGHVDDPD